MEERVDSYFGCMFVKINNKWVRKHRVIMEERLGRKLKRNEVVHHIDGNKLNNNIDNLKVMTYGEHQNLHRLGIKLSEDTCKKMSIVSKERNLKPEYNKMISERCKKQHEEGVLGNGKKGEENKTSKLKDQEIREIRYLYSLEYKVGIFTRKRFYQYEIAKMYGVSQGIIQGITVGNSWSHIK